MAFYRSNCPTGWVLANGETHTIGGTSVKVPDLRGRFVRGADLGAGNDPDYSGRLALSGGIDPKVGSYQADEIKKHPSVHRRFK